MIRQSIFTGVLAISSAVSGLSATLTVQATATPDAGLYDYSYVFSVTGAGAGVDNIFLGSADLSPLNLLLKLNGNPTAGWSWLGNDTPQNYLQFFSTNGTTLGAGDALDVTFSSEFAPAAASFAVGLSSLTNVPTNSVSAVLGPTVIAPTATPEPGSILLLISGAGAIFVGRRHWARHFAGF